jgi:hypothetical protein
LSRDGHGLVHSNGCNTRGLFAQDVSDFHRKLLKVSRRVSGARLVYVIPIVNRLLTTSPALKMAISLTFSAGSKSRCILYSSLRAQKRGADRAPLDRSDE